MKQSARANWLIPLGITGIMVITFVWMLPRLGFYLDDWPNLYYDKVLGHEATKLFHIYDGRPLMGWFSVLMFKLVGYRPLGWQIAALVFRFVMVLSTWLTFKTVWPKSAKVVGSAGLLLAVYPIFAQQAMSVTFAPHWFSFMTWAISMWLMVLAVRHARWTVPLIILSVLIDIAGLTVIEYFLALELVRMPVLWAALRNQETERKKIVGQGFLLFLPYLFTTAAYVIWRWFLIKLPVTDRLGVTLLSDLKSAPLDAILNLVRMALQDITEMLVSGWYKTLNPEIFAVNSPADVLAWAAFAAALILALFIILTLTFKVSEEESAQEKGQIYWIGLLILLLGLAPGWLIGRQLSMDTGLWNDRFGMGAMPGAALLVAALIFDVFKTKRMQIGVLVALIGLAAGWNVRVLNEYRWSWVYQQRVYQQLLWRAPGIQPGTLFLSENEIFPWMGVYPTSYAFNTLYPHTRDADRLDTYFATIKKYIGTDEPDAQDDTPLFVQKWITKYQGSTKNGVLLHFKSQSAQCLWVLKPSDVSNPFITDFEKEQLSRSHLEQILPDSAPGYPRWDILGQEAPHDWCYYYQKADLAWQLEDWEQILGLWAQSEPYRGSINALTELSPFLMGMIKTGNTDEAMEMSRTMTAKDEGMYPYVCDIWEEGLTNNTRFDPAAAAPLLKELECALR